MDTFLPLIFFIGVLTMLGCGFALVILSALSALAKVFIIAAVCSALSLAVARIVS